ncbi:hypothetical protein [uncultured Jatrophihabitans sp.]|uniref:hypothetical protein n=1 Tax=uncultured Jatrophihabitans sp. TaxID=1610747 RepID=UPI0035CA1B4F
MTNLVHPFYDAEATRLEVRHADIALSHGDGSKTHVVNVEAWTPGLDPVLVQMEQAEAQAFAEAVTAGFEPAEKTYCGARNPNNAEGGHCTLPADHADGFHAAQTEEGGLPYVVWQ